MKRRTIENHQNAVRTALHLIRDRPAGDGDSLGELANSAALSPFHFERVFKQQTGITPKAHVRQLRLIRAAVALRTHMGRIVDIALTCGYANHESFSRAFRRQFGVTPQTYRRRHLPSKRGLSMKDLHPAVNLVKIPITDFARGRAFYRDVLGLEEEMAVEEYGWAQFKAGALPLCLYVVGKGGGDGEPGNELNFHLAVDDLKQAYARIKRKGAKIPCTPTSSDEGGSFFIVVDPDGNRFKIVQRV